VVPIVGERAVALRGGRDRKAVVETQAIATDLAEELAQAVRADRVRALRHVLRARPRIEEDQAMAARSREVEDAGMRARERSHHLDRGEMIGLRGALVVAGELAIAERLEARQVDLEPLAALFRALDRALDAALLAHESVGARGKEPAHRAQVARRDHQRLEIAERVLVAQHERFDLGEPRIGAGLLDRFGDDVGVGTFLVVAAHAAERAAEARGVRRETYTSVVRRLEGIGSVRTARVSEDRLGAHARRLAGRDRALLEHRAKGARHRRGRRRLRPVLDRGAAHAADTGRRDRIALEAIEEIVEARGDLADLRRATIAGAGRARVHSDREVDPAVRFEALAARDQEGDAAGLRVEVRADRRGIEEALDHDEVDRARFEPAR
jgi:hypothetical protein